MTLEDLQKSCDWMLMHRADCEDAELAHKYLPLLIELAKAVDIQIENLPGHTTAQVLIARKRIRKALDGEL